MKIYHRLSKSIATKIRYSKTNINTIENIYLENKHTWIWMFPNLFLMVKNMPRKTEKSLLMHLPLCTSSAIHMHAACVHPV